MSAPGSSAPAPEGGERARRREWAASWRERAVVALGEAAVALPRPEGRKPAWDEWVDVDHWTWVSAVQCEAGLTAPSEPFVDSVPNGARRVGLATLRVWLSGDAPDSGSAAARVVAGDRDPSEDDELGIGLRGWIDELDPASRAALAADAATYALRAVRVGVRRGHHVHGPGGARRRWELPGSRLRLDAKVEVASSRVLTAADLRLMVLDTTSPTPGRAQGLAAWVALCHALACSTVPVSITVRNLRTGTGDRLEVDDALLGLALEQAAVAARAKAAAASTDSFGSAALSYRPGRWCHRCTALDLCQEGQEWVGSPRPAAI